jgi:hypothetical protein
LVALVVRRTEAAHSAGFVVIFPVVFATSMFVPVATMPHWLQAFAKVSPVTLTANIARSIFASWAARPRWRERWPGAADCSPCSSRFACGGTGA